MHTRAARVWEGDAERGSARWVGVSIVDESFRSYVARRECSILRGVQNSGKNDERATACALNGEQASFVVVGFGSDGARGCGLGGLFGGCRLF